MSWAIGFDEHWKRDIGYGVIAYCDHPRCHEVIDRGLSFVCGGGPYGEHPDGKRSGCGLYFCSDHLGWGGGQYCPRCGTHKPPYKHPKPEHPDWLRWKLTDESWAKWRADNPQEVAAMQQQLRAAKEEVKRG